MTISINNDFYSILLLCIGLCLSISYYVLLLILHYNKYKRKNALVVINDCIYVYREEQFLLTDEKTKESTQDASELAKFGGHEDLILEIYGKRKTTKYVLDRLNSLEIEYRRGEQL